AGGDALADFTDVTGRGGGTLNAVEGLGQDPRRGRFADAARTGEEVGVGDPITLEGVGKGLRYGFLTDQVRKLLWPAAPRQHGIVLPVGVRRRHAGGFWIFDCRTSLNRHASIKNRPVKKGARGGFPREADPLHKGSLLMAAPSGLTRFTTSLCV